MQPNVRSSARALLLLTSEVPGSTVVLREWVNVSSGIGLPGLSRIKGRKTVVVVVVFHHPLSLSFISTFLFCKPFPRQPFFFFFRTDCMIPQTFTVTSEHIRFYFSVFLFYTF